MTTESELDVIKNLDTNENKDEVKNEEIPVEQQPIEPPPIEDEKPKRPGRKKRDLAAISNVKSENLSSDNAMDTQPLFEQPVILEGKRSRKPTARLELSDLTPPKKELSIPQGHGKPLGEIEYINYQITQASTDVLSRFRNICFGRRGSNTDIRKNLRDFNGFEFERDSEEYQRHLNNLTKLKKEQLQSLSDVLGLPTSDRNDENAEKILTFLMAPVDEGKPIPIPERKMSMRTTTTKATINSKETIPTDDEEKTENGDDDADELFYVDDEEEEEEDATDDDYIGSDDESGLHTKDDPDDFVYQPGKKTPKKRSSIKRSRSRTSPKRKRTATSRRGRKKSKVLKVAVDKQVENEDLATVPTEPMQTNNQEPEEPEKPENNQVDLNNLDTEPAEQTATTTTDIIPATS